MRNRIVGAFALGMLTGSMITGSVVLFTSPAHADPVNEVATAVCSALDSNPTVGEVSHLITIFVSHGATEYQAGMFVAQSIDNYCTRHTGVFIDFVHQFGPANSGGAVA